MIKLIFLFSLELLLLLSCSVNNDLGKSYAYKFENTYDDEYYFRKYYNDTSFWEFRVFGNVIIDSNQYVIKSDGWYVFKRNRIIPYFTDSMFQDVNSQNQNKSIYYRPLRMVIKNDLKYYLCEYVDNLSFRSEVYDTIFSYFHMDSGFVKTVWKDSLLVTERMQIIDGITDVNGLIRVEKEKDGEY